MRPPSGIVRYVDGLPASTRVIVAAALGVVAGTLASFLTFAQAAALIGWDVSAATFLLAVWASVWSLDPEGTRREATRIDPSRSVVDLVVITAGVAMLAAVALALVRAGGAHGGTRRTS